MDALVLLCGLLLRVDARVEVGDVALELFALTGQGSLEVHQLDRRVVADFVRLVRLLDDVRHILLPVVQVLLQLAVDAVKDHALLPQVIDLLPQLLVARQRLVELHQRLQEGGRFGGSERKEGRKEGMRWEAGEQGGKGDPRSSARLRGDERTLSRRFSRMRICFCIMARFSFPALAPPTSRRCRRRRQRRE